MGNAIRRGEIYYADLNPVIGSEQGGRRPVLVIQNDTGNTFSSTVIVAAITSKVKPSLPTHLPLSDVTGLSEESVVLLEQLRTIDKRRLCSRAGVLGLVAMRLVDAALATSLGLTYRPKDAQVMVLCRTCVQSFRDSDEYKVYRVDQNQKVKETCTVCHVRNGFDFEVVRK